MDLVQSAIRTLYYDVNIEKTIEDIKKGCCTFLKSDFASLSAWTNQEFTRSELALLQSFVLQNTVGDMTPKWHHSLLLLEKFTERCLILHGNNIPVVNFKELQYWRELSLLIGEDLFITSFLALCAQKYKIIINFDWPNILGHNEQDVNQVLSDGLCDVHAHLKASADIFELTWLDFMNRVVNRDEDYRGVQYLADISLQSKRDEKTSSFRKMVQVAAILRMYLYEYDQGKAKAKDANLIKTIIDDDKIRISYLVDIQSKIATYKLANHSDYDYVNRLPLNANIYMVHHGERSLLYNYFSKYYGRVPSALKVADLFFLYISLKVRIRKEFVQTNPLYGFENFKIYESRKSKYSDRYKALYPLYAVQSSLRNNINDGFEARVTPGGIPKYELDIALDRKTVLKNINSQSLSFVIHFIKKNERKVHKKNFGMRYDFKADYSRDIQQVLNDADRRNLVRTPLRPVPKIVGIDAAGEEIECSPAIFGHIYRYARLCGLINLTYHVGEDFYDLGDGLKNIDDAIRFLDLQDGSRLGHALALGVNASTYYEKRDYQVIMSKQRLLDVLVWICQTCKQAGIDLSVDFIQKLSNIMADLYKTIGYGDEFNEKSYYKSMLLRSDDIVNVVRSRWDKASLCIDTQCIKARLDPIAQKLCKQFLTSKTIWENGNTVEIFRYPSEISSIIYKLQNYMMSIIVQKCIAIETNPSSNVKIGPIDGYNNHPIFRFISNGLNVSINTDDKGIFATSLPNEYSLVANAYHHNGHTVKESALLIDRLKKQAWSHRFKEQKIKIIQ